MTFSLEGVIDNKLHVRTRVTAYHHRKRKLFDLDVGFFFLRHSRPEDLHRAMTTVSTKIVQFRSSWARCKGKDIQLFSFQINIFFWKKNPITLTIGLFTPYIRCNRGKNGHIFGCDQSYMYVAENLIRSGHSETVCNNNNNVVDGKGGNECGKTHYILPKMLNSNYMWITVVVYRQTKTTRKVCSCCTHSLADEIYGNDWEPKINIYWVLTRTKQLPFFVQIFVHIPTTFYVECTIHFTMSVNLSINLWSMNYDHSHSPHNSCLRHFRLVHDFSPHSHMIYFSSVHFPNFINDILRTRSYIALLSLAY